jgi:hypothetical protein
MTTRFVARLAAFAIVWLVWLGMCPPLTAAPKPKVQFTTDFRLEDCEFQTEGVNPYFLLTPGRKLVLQNDDETETVEITVLEDLEQISVPGLGLVTTRVVEERETADGQLIEVSRNFFAICGGRNDVVYFGEDVDIHNPDGSITHEGEWRAGQPDENGVAEPGIIMPGTFLLGARYFQEIAEGIALDRAEHVEMGLDVETEAGSFHDCVRIVETSPLEPKSESEKIYCPGVGLVVDSDVQLVEIEEP